MVDDATRQAMQREKIAAQDSLARERLRTQESIASERSGRAVTLQEQRLAHQRQAKELDLAGRSDVARIAGEFDIELERLRHQQLPERLAIEHEYAALASELAKDEMLHEAGVQALFAAAEFGAKAKISGKFEKERDDRQFAHAVKLEKLRQQGIAQGAAEGKAPTAGELEAWYERTKNARK